eukprot:2542187-Amphidinium_carterae.1
MLFLTLLSPKTRSHWLRERGGLAEKAARWRRFLATCFKQFHQTASRFGGGRLASTRSLFLFCPLADGEQLDPSTCEGGSL